MFVRFRQSRLRLQVSLLESRRIDGRVRNEHVASLGSVEVPQTVEARIAFWQRLHERLTKLSNRVDAAMHAKILTDIHARIPMVTLDEQHGLQLRNAHADEQFWTTLRGMVEDNVAGPSPPAPRSTPAPSRPAGGPPHWTPPAWPQRPACALALTRTLPIPIGHRRPCALSGQHGRVVDGRRYRDRPGCCRRRPSRCDD
jgi:hypothetical protein